MAQNPLRIHVVALQDSTGLVPVGFADLLRKSIALAATMPGGARRRGLEVRTVAASRERVVVSAGGVQLGCDLALHEVTASDLVLVPALDPDLAAHLELNRAVVPWLKRCFLSGADIASACTGAFLLAEAGLLDGKSATTHWAFQPAFAARYPRVRLEPEAIVVDQGRVITAGGATSFINLTLYLVERLLGAEVARLASRMFLAEVNKAPQGAFAIFGPQRLHGDQAILRAQDVIERELSRAPAVGELARRVAMSRRNFVRRFTAATGNTPRDYVHRVRVEAAKRALESGPRSVAEVALDVGYGDVVAFRRLFTRATGLTPAEYRARYGPRSEPAFVTRQRAAVRRSSRARRA